MPPKRKRSSDAVDQDNTSQRNEPYAYLKPQVRHISERTIKSKWSTLPEPAQDKIRDMFRALERPVIVRQQNDKKRYEAQAAVQAVVKKCVISARHHLGIYLIANCLAIVLEGDSLECLFLH
jgi:kinetochore protein Fta7